ncbi:DMT family transporter [Serinibacter salmoneus]|uniref:Small multidrug resistance pump n=1 Tax=Serinibacter salmoneus TaxID=556530 RepID=A0A2A9D2J5_9MICO|nr:SMR family transporter [Serinibacter salmoneus]PFG20080.1 small multidrug resistance pump [Serinibacter salmoneus]
MGWLFVAGAIVFEVAATMALRAAVHGTRAWYILVGSGYLVSFTMLSLALAAGIPLGVAYGVWSATGIALTAILSKFIFKEPLTLLMTIGIALVIGGVVFVETGVSH